MSFLQTRLLQFAKWNKIGSYNFHTTCITTSNTHKFRGERYPEYRRNNTNRFGPLTNLPDYTFMDGRPTPLGMRQTFRVKQQRIYAQKLVTAIYEVDFAKERHQKLTKEEADRRQSILDGKLKPKGKSLLNK